MTWPTPPLGSLVTTIVPARDKPQNLDGPIPWLRIEDFDGQYVGTSATDQGVTEETIASMNLKVFPTGTVICTCSCSMGTTAIASRPLITNQTFIGLLPRDGALNSRFLYWSLQGVRDRLNATATGAIQQYLSRDDFRQLRLPVPPPEMQLAIADYLDTETARIDALIAKKQRLHDLIIARFASFREGLYRHDLAENGSVCLRHIVRCLDGARIPLNTEERSTRQGAYPYWGAGNIVDYVDDYLFDEELVLLGEDGAPFFDRTRDVAFHICERVWVNNHIHVLRCSASVHAEWLTHMLNAVDYGAYISGSTRDKLTQEQLLEIRVPLLSMDSQMSRLGALNAARSNKDEITSRLATQIELLREHRQALITAAVTGEFEIPGVAA